MLWLGKEGDVSGRMAMSVPTRGRRKRVRVEVTLGRNFMNDEGFLSNLRERMCGGDN